VPCAVLGSDADSTGGGQFFTAPPINFGVMSAAAGFSICMWFKVELPRVWSRIFDFGFGAQNIVLADFEGTGSLVVLRYSPCSASSDTFSFTFPAPISYGQWRHVCIMNQAKNWFFYDNGVLRGSDQIPCSVGDVVLTSNYIGRSNWAADRLLRGSIAEFRIYNRVLYASEVAALHANTGTKPLCVMIMMLDHRAIVDCF
jgi:hypothetical protein